MEYVYIIKSTLLGGYKIGITNNIDRRMKQLEVPKKAIKLAVFSCNHSRVLEKTIHKNYDEFRIPQSEWFDLTDTALSSVIEYLKYNAQTVFLDCPNYTPAVKPKTSVVKVMPIILIDGVPNLPELDYGEKPDWTSVRPAQDVLAELSAQSIIPVEPKRPSIRQRLSTLKDIFLSKIA